MDEGRRYSCPIPPAENHLPVEVKAGVKGGFRSFSNQHAKYFSLACLVQCRDVKTMDHQSRK
uniref:DUF1684 domain-containing protein n=1 Tax=Nonlabens sp. Ci31 TaxID=2608253 RepID=UPI001474644F